MSPLLVAVLGLGACRSGEIAPRDAVPCRSSAQMAIDGVVRTEGGGCGRVSFDVVDVLGEGTFTVDWFTDGESVVPVVSGEGVFEGLHARGTWELEGADDAVLWRQGWQSWSASGVFPLVAPELVDGRPVAGGDAGTFEVVEETPGTSWWMGAVGTPGGPTLGVGVTSARETGFHVAFDPDGTVHAVWGGQGEQVPLDGELYLDALWAQFEPTPDALVDRWAAAVATAVPPRRTPAPPTGWSSWYVFYDDVTEADVRANLAQAVALRDAGVPIEVIQVDDGWARAWGDWHANGDFPSGMQALAADIRAAGFTPGLWMAPFHVSRDLTLADEHPDWFLHTVEGELHVDNGYHVIDVTHPDASAWMAQQVADRVAEGWTYLKLDFLIGGALNGVRQEPIAGVLAYQLGLRAIREAAGDAWILACGAPMLPTVGHAESWRSGPDIAFVPSPDPELAFLRNQGRSTAARGFTNGSWWWIDADPVLVRPPADDALARGAAVVAAVSGGAWLAGDDLTTLDDQRLGWALPPAVMALRGGDVRPDAPLAAVSGFDTSPLFELADGDDVVPSRWVWQTGEVALLNLSTEPVTLDGPGGTELLTGATAGPGSRTLQPGDGEIWRP